MSEAFDLQSLLRALQERPELREELQRLLGGGRTPTEAALVQLAEAQRRTEDRVGDLAEHLVTLTRRVDTLTEQMTTLTARVDALTARVDALTERMDALAEAQRRTEERLDTLTARVDALTEQMTTLTARVDALTEQMTTLTGEVTLMKRDLQKVRGESLERQYRERGYAYLGRVARRIRLLSSTELDDVLEAAVEQGVMEEAEADLVRLADAVFEGRRRPDRAPCYVVLEASLGVGPEDVQRARERADILGRTGVPTIPVVAGEWLTPEARSTVRDLGVWQVTNGRAVPPDDGADPQPDLRRVQ